MNNNQMEQAVRAIQCAICRKPVDSVTIGARGEDAMRHHCSIEVACHGQTERVVIPRNVLVGHDLATTRFGEAFATKALPEAT